MMTSKTKKKRFNPRFDFFLYLLSPFTRFTLARATIAVVGLVLFSVTAMPVKPAARFQSSSSASHAHDFVIFTTVFTDQGFTLYGARTKLRRAEEKKFRWEATSDHQGELAFRVPQGAEYEMTIEARGFKTQTRKIDAREDLRVDLTVRMELANASHAPNDGPQAEKSPGGKP